MPSVSTLVNGVRQKLAGRALMDVAFSNSSTNGVQNKVIKAKFDEVDDKLSSRFPKGKVEVVPDGVKTYEQLLNELYAKVDNTLINQHTVYEMEYSNGEHDTFRIIKWNPTTRLVFEQNRVYSTGIKTESVAVSSISDAVTITIVSGGVTKTDNNDIVLPVNDRIIRIIY